MQGMFPFQMQSKLGLPVKSPGTVQSLKHEGSVPGTHMPTSNFGQVCFILQGSSGNKLKGKRDIEAVIYYL